MILLRCRAEDDSPYPEVRAAVANTDDPDMPCATFRAWLVGLIWAIIIPGLDQFFFFRYPSVTITGVRPPAIISLAHIFFTNLESLRRRSSRS